MKWLKLITRKINCEITEEHVFTKYLNLKIIFQKLLLVECKLFWWTVTYQHERWINSSYETLISERESCGILVDDLVDSKRWCADAENVTTTLFPHPLPLNCQLSFSKRFTAVQLRDQRSYFFRSSLLKISLIKLRNIGITYRHKT